MYESRVAGEIFTTEGTERTKDASLLDYVRVTKSPPKQSLGRGTR
jgi:hypothetical protein